MLMPWKLVHLNSKGIEGRKQEMEFKVKNTEKRLEAFDLEAREDFWKVESQTGSLFFFQPKIRSVDQQIAIKS